MIRGIVANGLIQLVEPLPPEWSEGQEVQVELDSAGPEQVRRDHVDEWHRELERCAAVIDPEDDKRFGEAIAHIRREAKELARREMEVHP